MLEIEITRKNLVAGARKYTYDKMRIIDSTSGLFYLFIVYIIAQRLGIDFFFG
jgi:dolichyl-phosphate-mannose--protein O-mannosyl transferase